jgi:hypothetical protein
MLMGKPFFASNADQAKEMAKVAKHKDLGSSSFRKKEEL